jgi:hypothetical protein
MLSSFISLALFNLALGFPQDSTGSNSQGLGGSINYNTTATLNSSVTYKATITEYGLGDSFGSQNCSSTKAACGFFNAPGFMAAASQALYDGLGGPGSACGTCWLLTAETDNMGNPLSGVSPIVVQVNNECPANVNNTLCQQSSLTDTNSLGANVNFDLCIQSGAPSGLFGTGHPGLAVGTATQVSCSKWQGGPRITG